MRGQPALRREGAHIDDLAAACAQRMAGTAACAMCSTVRTFRSKRNSGCFRWFHARLRPCGSRRRCCTARRSGRSAAGRRRQPRPAPARRQQVGRGKQPGRRFRTEGLRQRFGLQIDQHQIVAWAAKACTTAWTQIAGGTGDEDGTARLRHGEPRSAKKTARLAAATATVSTATRVVSPPLVRSSASAGAGDQSTISRRRGIRLVEKQPLLEPVWHSETMSSSARRRYSICRLCTWRSRPARWSSRRCSPPLTGDSNQRPLPDTGYTRPFLAPVTTSRK